jgi:arylsulfatase
MVRLLFAALLVLVPAAQDAPPNVVFILADDLGWGELGSYGQAKIRTPNLDRLAAEGLRFTDAYSGSAVCAPSRCTLMTGLHGGRAHVRSNREIKPEGQEPLPGAVVTLPEVLKARGYATGAFGKWGLGGPESEGAPRRQGFDRFYGYNCQRVAHSYYPTYLWSDDRKVELPGNDGQKGTQYSHDLIEAEALKWIRERKDGPFFAYLAFTIPHVAMQVPEDSLEEYRGRWEDPAYTGGAGYTPHPQPRAAHAAMITRMDRGVGRVLDLLQELGLEKNTLVIFTSDNGSIDRVGGHDLAFFSGNGPFRGQKGSLHEGGIRVPFIARWTGRIAAGSTSALPTAFDDVLPTLAELAGAEPPKGGTGVSLVPTLLGREGQKVREALFWEFQGYGGWQAVRKGNWKAVRQGLAKAKTPFQLYDLAADPSEKNDLAASKPELVREFEALLRANREPSAIFPLKGLDE